MWFIIQAALGILCAFVIGAGIGSIAANTDEPVGSAVLAIVSALFGAAAVEMLLWQGRKNDVETALKEAGELPEGKAAIIRRELGVERNHQWTPLISLLASVLFFVGLWIGLGVTAYSLAGQEYRPQITAEPGTASTAIILSPKNQFAVHANYVYCKQLGVSRADTEAVIESLIKALDAKAFGNDPPKLKDWIPAEASRKQSKTFGAP